MIVAFTGAGISKASGIPTFDEMGDLRTKLERHFANTHPEEFQKIMETLNKTRESAEPNDAHVALAEYDIPVITMNIDSLHRCAGTRHLIEVHGSLQNNNVVLYGDDAPGYSDAFDWVDRMHEGDVLLVIGTSFYTSISSQIRSFAEENGATVIVVNEDAEHKVRELLNQYRDSWEDFQSFEAREPMWIRRFIPYNY